jgi:hypothetical protein
MSLVSRVTAGGHRKYGRVKGERTAAAGLDLEALCSAAEAKEAEALLGLLMKHVLLWSRLDDEQRNRG